MEEQNLNATVFVKIDEYKDVLSSIGLLKSKVKEARATLSKIESLRAQEEEEIVAWTSALNDIEGKISNIENNLGELETG